MTLCNACKINFDQVRADLSVRCHCAAVTVRRSLFGSHYTAVTVGSSPLSPRLPRHVLLAGVPWPCALPSLTALVSLLGGTVCPS